MTVPPYRSEGLESGGIDEVFTSSRRTFVGGAVLCVTSLDLCSVQPFLDHLVKQAPRINRLFSHPLNVPFCTRALFHREYLPRVLWGR